MSGDLNQRAKDMQPVKRFQTGGAVRPGVFYIERTADEELPAALLEGEFCYVLAPRQMGKSSLRVRAAEKLGEQGVRCATVDLQKIGSGNDIKISDWYFSVLDEVNRGLGLNCDLQAFWAKHGQQLQEGDAQGRSTLPHCWSAFLQYEVLAHTSVPIVIFIDEIDSVLSLPFSTDDFFAVIRSTHEARPEKAEYNRLTFCLLGVAAPNDLIRDTTRTPFNIGRPVFLEDFSWPQTRSFLSGISSVGSDPLKLLQTMYDWTGGQPYMTQKLCYEIARGGAPATQTEEETVRNLIDTIFLQKGRTGDPNLRYAEDRFDKIGSPSTKSQVLQLYRRLLNGQHVQLDAESPAQSELKLTGLAAERRYKGGVFLQQRNRIFASVFDKNWIREKEGERLFQEALAKWLEARHRGDSGGEYLLRGKALEEGLVWADTRADVTKEERDFLLASQEQSRRDAVEQAEARAAKRFRILSVALAIATILALSALAYAAQKAREARASADVIAEQNVVLRQRTVALEEATEGLRDEQSITKEAKRQLEITVGALKKSNQALEAQTEVAVKAQEAAEKSAGKLKESVGALERQKVAADQATDKAERNLKSLYLAYARRELSLEQPEPVRAAVYLAESCEMIDPKHKDEKDELILRNLSWMSQFLDPLITLGERSVARFSPDGHRLISSDNDRKVVLWDTQTGKPIKELNEGSIVPNNPWSADGKRLMIISSPNRTELWDAETGKPINELSNSININTGLYWSDNGKRLLTLEPDDVRLWDTQTATLIKKLPTTLRPSQPEVSWSPDGSRLVTENKEGMVQVWDAQTGVSVTDLPIQFASSGTKLLWAAKGRRFVTVDTEGKVQLWNAETGLLINDLPVILPLNPLGDQSTANLLVNNERLLTNSAEGVKLWDALTGTLVKSLPVNGTDVGLKWSGDGQRIMTWSEGKVQLWNGQSGALVAALPVTASLVYGTGKSRRLLTVSAEGRLQLWDADTGARVRDLHLLVPFDSDSDAISTGDADRLLTGNREGVKLWDSRTGALVATLPIATDDVDRVQWSEDGEWFVMEYYMKENREKEKLTQLWNARTGELVAFLPIKKRFNDRADLSWVGRRLLTRNTQDGSMHLWELKPRPSTPQELVKKVRQLAPFKLEKEELIYKPGREPKKPEGQ